MDADAARLERARLAGGHTHISSFAAGDDKRAVALPCGAVVAFRVAFGVAVSAGDPLAVRETRDQAISEFGRLCRDQGWRPCYFQTAPEHRATYRAQGMRLVKFGEEAVLDLDGFTLAVPARANLRREVGRARRAGLSAAVVECSAIDAQLSEKLRAVSAEWLRRRGGEMGFSLGRLEEGVDRRGWLVVVTDAAGELHGFSSWLPLGADGIALDLVRRRPDAGPGTMDLCITTALQEGRQRGLRRASLGSVPTRDLDGDGPDGLVSRRVRSWLYRRGVSGYQYRSLASFKDKFAPRWESRDIALPRGVAGVAAVAALAAVHLRPPAPAAMPTRPVVTGPALHVPVSPTS
jgi:phosphatidylglycerol lysyltransferase